MIRTSDTTAVTCYARLADPSKHDSDIIAVIEKLRNIGVDDGRPGNCDVAETREITIARNEIMLTKYNNDVPWFRELFMTFQELGIGAILGFDLFVEFLSDVHDLLKPVAGPDELKDYYGAIL